VKVGDNEIKTFIELLVITKLEYRRKHKAWCFSQQLLAHQLAASHLQLMRVGNFISWTPQKFLSDNPCMLQKFTLQCQP